MEVVTDTIRREFKSFKREIEEKVQRQEQVRIKRKLENREKRKGE